MGLSQQDRRSTEPGRQDQQPMGPAHQDRPSTEPGRRDPQSMGPPQQDPRAADGSLPKVSRQRQLCPPRQRWPQGPRPQGQPAPDRPPASLRRAPRQPPWRSLLWTLAH
jgi:hypothetical protein